MGKSILSLLMFWKWGWLQNLAKWAYKKVILKFVKELSKEEIAFITDRIKYYATDLHMDGYAKIKMINKDFKARYTKNNILNSVLNAGITTLFSLLEQDGEL